jgi:ribulose-5-phosphate 4-epimerase/fuculose-1-phosphate aldolase
MTHPIEPTVDLHLREQIVAACRDLTRLGLTHGTSGASLSAALTLAAEVENLAAQYCAALAIGGVDLLDEAQMQPVLEKFRTYGREFAVDSDLAFAGANLDDIQVQA